MRAIIAAFALQGIEVVWRGPEPASADDLTADYLAENVEGLPRMRPEDAVFDLAQLKADYAAEQVRALVPIRVTARQARLALLNAGLLGLVNSSLETIPGAAGDAARIEWEYALVIERQSPLVSTLSAQLGLTDAQVDALFLAAEGI